MHALIDLDILCYEMGSSVDENGYPLDWPLVRWRVSERINTILQRTEATSWQGYLTSQDKSNFRYKIATIKPYKDHRQKREKPYWYQDVYDYLAKDRKGIVVHDMEADDSLSIAQWENLRDVMKSARGKKDLKGNADTIICTRDKDLLMVPGWHYGWESFNQKEKEPFWVAPTQGIRSFYKQMLLGDVADNIPGLYSVGVRSAPYRRLDELDNELDMFKLVYSWYTKFYNSYAEQFMLEVGNLLWMKRTVEDKWRFPQGWRDKVEPQTMETED